MRATKADFRRRLDLAAVATREFTEQFVIERLPPEVLFRLTAYDDPSGRRGPAGTVKFLGGRFLRPEDFLDLSSRRLGDLLWIDGRVPAWVNFSPESLDDSYTYIRVRFSKKLLPLEQAVQGRDYGAAPDNPYAPFRIRGPGLPPGWKSREESGRFSLLWRGEGSADG